MAPRTALKLYGTALLALQSAASPLAIGKELETRHEAKDQLGAVASESDICSRIGVNLLKEGGNAADAMVGTVVCVGTVGMYHSGMFWLHFIGHIHCGFSSFPFERPWSIRGKV